MENGFTRADFREGRNRRFGKTNPEEFDIEYWNRAVKHEITPHEVRQYYALDSKYWDKPNDLARRNMFIAKMEAAFKKSGRKPKQVAVDRAIERLSFVKAPPPVEFAQAKYGDKVGGEGRSFGDTNAIFMSNPIFSAVREGQTSTHLPGGSTV
jgi:hypothetical protein